MTPLNQSEERAEMNKKISQTTTMSPSQLWSEEDQLMFLQFQRETHTPQMDQLPLHQPSTKVSHMMTETKGFAKKYIIVNNEKVELKMNEIKDDCEYNQVVRD